MLSRMKALLKARVRDKTKEIMIKLSPSERLNKTVATANLRNKCESEFE